MRSVSQARCGTLTPGSATAGREGSGPVVGACRPTLATHLYTTVEKNNAGIRNPTPGPQITRSWKELSGMIKSDPAMNELYYL